MGEDVDPIHARLDGAGGSTQQLFRPVRSAGSFEQLDESFDAAPSGQLGPGTISDKISAFANEQAALSARRSKASTREGSEAHESRAQFGESVVKYDAEVEAKFRTT